VLSRGSKESRSQFASASSFFILHSSFFFSAVIISKFLAAIVFICSQSLFPQSQATVNCFASTTNSTMVSSSSSSVQQTIKRRRPVKHSPTHAAAFCGHIFQGQEMKGRRLSRTQSLSDFILAHPRYIDMCRTSPQSITSPLPTRKVSFDGNDRSLPISPPMALAQRISMRPRKLPASVARALGVSLLPALDAEATKSLAICSAFVREGEGHCGFMTPKRRSSYHPMDHPPVIRRDHCTDQFLSAPRPAPCHLLLPDELGESLSSGSPFVLKYSPR
jgi:hypothetical protein